MSVRWAEGLDSRLACVKLCVFVPGCLGYPKVGGLGHFPEVKNHTGPFIRGKERPAAANYGRAGMYMRDLGSEAMPLNVDLFLASTLKSVKRFCTDDKKIPRIFGNVFLYTLAS